MERQGGEQANRIEMTGVIRHEHERSIDRKMLGADNLETVIGPQPPSDDQGNERTNAINKHVGLARKMPQALEHALIEIGRWGVSPPFHRKG